MDRVNLTKGRALTGGERAAILPAVDTKELYTTAALAQLRLTEEEAEGLAVAVGQMLEYFSKMEEMAVEGLEPTTHALLKANRVREDVVAESTLADALLDNSPEREDRFIVIPNVL